jgi:hypothetical protein
MTFKAPGYLVLPYPIIVGVLGLASFFSLLYSPPPHQWWLHLGVQEASNGFGFLGLCLQNHGSCCVVECTLQSMSHNAATTKRQILLTSCKIVSKHLASAARLGLAVWQYGR